LNREGEAGYSTARMPSQGTSLGGRGDTVRGFEAIADAIVYRWSVERDTWVSATEILEVRAYLERAGIGTIALPDGRFRVEGEARDALGAARLVLVGLRHLYATRRGRQQP
jgi:hypothetical protein